MDVSGFHEMICKPLAYAWAGWKYVGANLVLLYFDLLAPLFLFIGKCSSIFLSLSKDNCNDCENLWFLKAFLLVLLMHFFVLMVLYMVDYLIYKSNSVCLCRLV